MIFPKRSASFAYAVLVGAASVFAGVFAGSTPALAERIENPVAVFSGIDKITGRITNFDVYVNETVQFGALQVTPKVCYSRDDSEAQRIDAFVEVDEITLDRKIRRIFSGWMFADSPGLNAVEHAIYDVWLSDCKASSDVPAPDGVVAAHPAPVPEQEQASKGQNDGQDGIVGTNGADFNSDAAGSNGVVSGQDGTATGDDDPMNHIVNMPPLDNPQTIVGDPSTGGQVQQGQSLDPNDPNAQFQQQNGQFQQNGEQPLNGQFPQDNQVLPDQGQPTPPANIPGVQPGSVGLF